MTGRGELSTSAERRKSKGKARFAFSAVLQPACSAAGKAYALEYHGLPSPRRRAHDHMVVFAERDFHHLRLEGVEEGVVEGRAEARRKLVDSSRCPFRRGVLNRRAPASPLRRLLAAALRAIRAAVCPAVAIDTAAACGAERKGVFEEESASYPKERSNPGRANAHLMPPCCGCPVFIYSPARYIAHGDCALGCVEKARRSASPRQKPKELRASPQPAHGRAGGHPQGWCEARRKRRRRPLLFQRTADESRADTVSSALLGGGNCGAGARLRLRPPPSCVPTLVLQSRSSSQ